MKWLVKFPLFIYVAVTLAINGEASFVAVVLCLLVAGLTVWKERFWNSIVLSGLLLAIVAYGTSQIPEFAALLSIPLYDFVRSKHYSAAAVPFVLAIWLAGWSREAVWLYPLMAAYGLLAYRVRLSEERESRYRETLDGERSLRYELESAKVKLLRSAREIAGITEIQERNRIAREIHDSVGHSLAGILIQLQASRKMIEKGVEPERAGEMLAGAVTGLSDALGLLRDTVHNLKPKQELGIEFIRQIIESFKFCEVDFRFTGDVQSLKPDALELVVNVIKEGMTNASKHSKADHMDIRLDVTENYVRLMLRDNGVGCSKIREGLGLSGMRERFRNRGGSFTAGGEDGFTLVGLIPGEKGERILENRNSR
jgi:signal transduction histidine kinase